MPWGALSCPPQVRNEKARRFLSQMKPKPAVSFAVRFPRAHPSAVRLLERLLAFDPNKRCGVAPRACVRCGVAARIVADARAAACGGQPRRG